MNPVVLVPASVIAGTLSELQSAGRNWSERVVLWLGRRDGDSIRVEALWIPEQQAGYDFFEISPEAMQALFDALRARRLMVAAQVHTHPHRAFHSYADDKWAIVRHCGALSVVLPDFGLKTVPATFVQEAAVFVLSSANQWLETPSEDVHNLYQICP